MREKLTQQDFEALTAWLDGELAGQDAGRVERLVREDAAWRAEANAQRRLEAILAEADELPPVPADLAERVLAHVRRQTRRPPMVIRLARRLAPVAAAAAVLIAVMVWRPWSRPGGTDVGPPVAEKKLPAAEEEFVAENVDFFRNYEVCDVMASNADVIDMATLEAIDDLERNKSGI